MHLPDGFINVPISAGGFLVAAATCLGATRLMPSSKQFELARRAGLVSAFVFAAQMINFPVALGTSGHLVGACFATILLGPQIAILSVSVVIFIQCFFFGDGGVSALGLNVTNMAIIGSLVSYLVFHCCELLLGKSKVSLALGSFLGGFMSMGVAGAALSSEMALGGVGLANPTAVFKALMGVHLLIALFEGLITAGLVLALMGNSYGARAPRLRTFLGLTTITVAAIFGAKFASKLPDGLGTVALRFNLKAVPKATTLMSPVVGALTAFIACLTIVWIAKPVGRARSRVELEILGFVLFASLVALTPLASFPWAFVGYVVLAIVGAVISGVRVREVLARLKIEVPFVLFAFAMPFLAAGERVNLAGLSLSVPGLYGGASIVVKSTLCLAVASILVLRHGRSVLIQGLSALGLSSFLVTTIEFMLRYLTTLGAQVSSLRIAREARGARDRWIWHAEAVLGSTAQLFARTLERDAKIAQAMAARGYEQ